MAKKSRYRIDMELTGRLTQIPDSQKIFGALIHRLAARRNSEQATQTVHQIMERRTYFSLSNLLPAEYLPLPYTFLMNNLLDNEKGNKQVYKELKKRAYVKKDTLQALLRNPACAQEAYPYVQLKEDQHIHASIDSKRFNLPGLDPNLYSVPGTTVIEIGKDQSEQAVKRYTFYLIIEDGEIHNLLLQLLNEECSAERPFILGPRGSQELNCYTITGIKQEEHNQTETIRGYCLNLGMLLPDHIDYGKSALKLFTSQRRPYNPPGGWDQAYVGQFISFIDAGSMIYVEGRMENTGKCLPSPHNSRDIIFGQAYLYPIEGQG